MIMGRYQSPLVKHDLSRLDDPESRHIALTSLKNCVKQLEAECIPYFLDQISENHHDISRPYIISLYEDLSRTHRTLLVPYIPRIMEALITALSESGSSMHVHRACAKVVASLSRFCIDLERHSQQAKEVLRLLCEPLLCVLVGKFEPVSAGAAVCLQALVESENWIHAPKELVNEVCFRVTAAMSGKLAPTVAHLQLACVVAKVNKDVFESYGLELMNAAKDVLQTAGSWTLRVAAAQLLNLVLGMVDGIVLSTEIASVIDVLERFRLDRMPKVRSSVAEALKTAKSCYYSGGRATTKMIFSVETKKRQEQLQDAGIRSILLPSFHNEFGKRDLRKPLPKYDRGGPEDVGGYDFVIVEDYGQQIGKRSSRSNGAGGRRPAKPRNDSRVRHTVSAEPGGYVIQEWIKVEDHERFPQCGMLAGIEEGEEYEEEPTYIRESAYGKPFYSPSSERHVVIFDEDQVVTDTCKRLIENSEATSAGSVPALDSVPVPSTSQASRSGAASISSLAPQEPEEWRDNPIAAKSDEGRSPYERSITPPARDASSTRPPEDAGIKNVGGRISASAASDRSGRAEEVTPPACSSGEVPTLNDVLEEILDPSPLREEQVVEAPQDEQIIQTPSFRDEKQTLYYCEEEQVIQQEVAAVAAESEKNRDSVEEPKKCSLSSPEEAEIKNFQATDAMVDTFRRSWEVLETDGKKHEVGHAVAEETAVTCSSRKQQLVSALTSSFSGEHKQADGGWHKLRKLQSGMERLLGGSVCAVLAIPAAMALIKCLEPNFGPVPT